MLALRALNEELGNPSATKLLQAAKKRKLKVTKAQVAEVVKEDSTREVFAQPQAQKGAHATNDEGAIWQADLVDLKEQGEKYKYALSVTDVFSRLTKIEPLETKAPGEVWAAFVKILDKFPKKPTKLDVDAGEEFKGAFSEGAESRGIVVQQKNSDVNAVAVSDAAIQSIKSNLFRDMAQKGSDKWSDKIEKAEKAYNSQPHESLMGEAPKDVKDADVVRFRLLQENAEKLRSNAKQLDQRQKRLMEAGAFRPQLAKQAFKRGFKPSYSGEVKTIDKVEGGTVVSGGQRYDIARVQPVSKDSKRVVAPEGSIARDSAKREELKRFVPQLKRFLADGGGTSMGAASTHLKSVPGFMGAMDRLRLNRPGGFQDFIKLFNSDFEIQGPESGPGQRTIKVRRRRLVGKQGA